MTTPTNSHKAWTDKGGYVTTMTRGERQMHSQLVVDNSKERLGPIGCETHTIRNHDATK